MTRKTARLLIGLLLVVVCLSASLIAGSSWVSDYLDYVHTTPWLSQEGDWRGASVGDFLQYRRARAFYDVVEELEASKATEEEVKKLLGEPDRVEEEPGRIVWYYPGPMFRGQRKRRIVLVIDPETLRVAELHYIVIG